MSGFLDGGLDRLAERGAMRRGEGAAGKNREQKKDGARAIGAHAVSRKRGVQYRARILTVPR